LAGPRHQVGQLSPRLLGSRAPHDLRSPLDWRAPQHHIEASALPWSTAVRRGIFTVRGG
jgi:hypothetical protein